ncbi:uncharacterized protein LOC129584303 isoform X1 [Paramacrobiotus metropolitanus]|uniref:uncharacterized protein LOC129584303 isoform X1 n=1 Tax=Paramacrobiotus metropolitanus TaxID=2943436 RepID=UPI002445B25E|nr:uncharacterized protein LOC129584303 isoform X1 [Paramacrobiotus metropolitanus]
MACAGPTSKAMMNCPFAGIGQRCADSASVCSANRKCICDPTLGSLDSTGTKCVRYTTTTTTTLAPCPTCVTCPVLTCPTTSATSTNSATSTTSASTTTATPTTMAPSTQCFTAGTVVDTVSGAQFSLCGACIMLTSTPTTLNIHGLNGKASVCAFTFIAPAGSGAQVDFDLPNFNLLTCTMGTFIVFGGSQYCSDQMPPPTIKLDANVATLIFVDNNQQTTNSLILQVKAAS